MTSKAVISLSTQCSSRGKHDSGVQIRNDTTDSARCVDTSLCAAGAGLEGRKDKGDLLADTAGVVLELAASVGILGVTLNLPSILYQLHAALPQVLHRGTDTVGNLHRHRKNIVNRSRNKLQQMVKYISTKLYHLVTPIYLLINMLSK